MIRRTRSRVKGELKENDVCTENGEKNGIAPSCANENKTKQKRPCISDDSSSESDIENYLKPAHEIDLNSSFFQKPQAEEAFDEIEKNILSGVNGVADLESSEDEEMGVEEREAVMEMQKANFQQMQEHLQKIEEAKKHIQEYEAKKRNTVKRKKLKTYNTPTNIADLLSIGEKLSNNVEETEENLSDDLPSMSESEREDWEEVKELKEKNIIPKKGVEITVQMPGVIREKKGVDLIAAMKRRLNRIKKENQVYIHKVSLLCWIAHGNFLNTTINSEKYLGLALSLLPSEQCYPKDRTDLGYLEQILMWYRKNVEYLEKSDDLNCDLNKQLHIDISKKQASNKRILVLIFVSILRALGIQCRLVMSLLVLPLKPLNSELCSLSTKKADEEKKTVDETKADKVKTVEGRASKKQIDTKKSDRKSVSDKSTKKSKENVVNNDAKITLKIKQKKEEKLQRSEMLKKVNKCETSKKPKSTEKGKKKVHFKDLNESRSNESPVKNSKPNLTKIRMSLRKKSDDSKAKLPQTDGADDSESDEPSSSTAKEKPNLKKLKETKTVKTHERRFKSLPDYKEIDSEDEFYPRSPLVRKNQHAPKVNLKKLKKRSNSASPRKIDVRNEIIKIVKEGMAEDKQKAKMKLGKTKRIQRESDEDSDYLPELIQKKKHDSDDEFIANLKPKVKKRVQVKRDGNGEEEQKRKGNDIWVEVFLEAEEKWISVDVIKKQVHCVNEIYKRATSPVSYILSWDNKNNIKDITKRYCPNWNTITRKLRVDPKWWEQTLKPFIGPKTAQDREEDEELARLQLEKPLPTTISEYKNHPLYVLKRHLLKFEAIYPPDAVTLGFVRNEPVYSRECVHTLHSRDIWLKHAKVVRLGEKPYKIVKARPKYDKLSNSIITDQMLEIFGSWQVDDYVPPTAENGVVPRNEYGNVDLFKTCMLPKGTVHLQLPGLNRIAKKLNIDCAPAVVGFDFHSGWSHPMFDGFVVCEEYKDVIVAAWEQEQEEAEKRAQEKIEKRVYENWRRLIKGLLIRERLKAKYDFGQPSTSGINKQKRKAKPPTLLVKKKR